MMDRVKIKFSVDVSILKDEIKINQLVNKIIAKIKIFKNKQHLFDVKKINKESKYF